MDFRSRTDRSHGRPMIEVELRLEGEKVTLVERFRPRALALRLELAP